MTGNRPVRAALYARVSTTGHGQDVGLQLDELRQVAAQRGYRATEYVDDGVSGTKASRPALDRLMSDARAGRLEIALVWRFDRFARNTAHLINAMEEFRALGVHFISLREQVDTSTPMGKAMFTIISAISELERDLIRERVVAGVQRARAAGKHCGRPRKAAADKALVAAKGLLDQGWGWRAVSEATGIQKDTLRRRLREAGMLAQNPPPDDTP
jgi:DNA invertase Pin-like site-specific DNA recombinase